MWTLLRRTTLTQWIVVAMVVGVYLGAVHPAFASLRGQREFAAVVASSFHTR